MITTLALLITNLLITGKNFLAVTQKSKLHILAFNKVKNKRVSLSYSHVANVIKLF